MYNNRKAWKAAFPMAAMLAAGRGWDSEGNSGRRHRRGSGSRRRVFGSGELRLVLLKLIGDEARHGYELIKAIGDLTGETYEPSPGAVYPTLQMLADEGVVKEAKPKKGDEAKKAFEITKSGKAELAERADEVAKIMDRLAGMSGREEHNRAPELFRAMGNLAGVLKNKYRGGGFEEKDLEEIVDIIDDAAKRIERL